MQGHVSAEEFFTLVQSSPVITYCSMSAWRVACATTIHFGTKIFIGVLYSMLYHVIMSFSIVLHIETHIISLMASEVVLQLQDLLPLEESIPGFLVCTLYLEKILYYLNSPRLDIACWILPKNIFISPTPFHLAIHLHDPTIYLVRYYCNSEDRSNAFLPV